MSPYPTQDDSAPPFYTCDNQGIQVGWGDLYDQSLDCQWVDITDVPAGDYALQIALNTEHLLSESNYDNDVATILVTIPADDSSTRPNSAP